MTELSDVCFSFENKPILRNFSYRFEPNKITALMGPSGAGKTTLLRLLAGLLFPQSGTIIVDTPIAMLFQEPRLCPWLSALENIALVLGKGDHKAEAAEWLSHVSLQEDANTFPKQLSGGMQQRVALARTLAFAKAKGCGLILLDEPFKGLDPILKAQIADLIVVTAKNKTVILVTHDTSDAEQFAQTTLYLPQMYE